MTGLPLAGLPLASLGLLTAQVLYATRRDLPSFTDLDPSGTVGDPALPPLRVLAMGDSTITGAGLDDPSEIWVRLVAQRLADRFHVEVTSLARGGARVRHVLSDQLPRALRMHPDLVLLSVGGNDALRGTPIGQLEADLEAVVASLTESGAAVALLGVGDLGTIPRLPRPLASLARVCGRRVDRVEARVAARHHGAAKADSWKAETTEAFRTQPELFAPDLFHASSAGHREWASLAIPAVEEALASR